MPWVELRFLFPLGRSVAPFSLGKNTIFAQWIALEALSRSGDLRGLPLILFISPPISSGSCSGLAKPKGCAQMFIADWLTLTKHWEQRTCSLAREWINYRVFTQWNTHYSLIKMKELLIHANTGINLKGMILSKRNQTWKRAYHRIPFIRASRTRKTGPWQ